MERAALNKDPDDDDDDGSGGGEEGGVRLSEEKPVLTWTVTDGCVGHMFQTQFALLLQSKPQPLFEISLNFFETCCSPTNVHAPGMLTLT
jgi:hypothetical protein